MNKKTEVQKNKQRKNPNKTTGGKKAELNMGTLFTIATPLENETLKVKAVRFFYKMKNTVQAWFWSCTRPLKNVLNWYEKEMFLFSSLFSYQMKRILYCTGCYSYWRTNYRGLTIIDEQATADALFQFCI